jgi:membrane protein required for beta-lactamase induction
MMEENPWFILIGALAVTAWAAVALAWVFTRHRRAGDDDSAILQRLDALDARLASVEKTLNEIP